MSLSDDPRELASPASSRKIRLSALLLSQNEELVEVVRDLGGKMAMTIDTCAHLLQATRKVATAKYQGILVDYSDELSASALINGVRGSTSNSADVVYAFVKDANQAVTARQLGANFIIPEPFTAESVAPYIRAGYGLMTHELRRYFRAPVVFPVWLATPDGRRIAARSIDLSSGGLAVEVPHVVMAGQRFHARFQVPDCSETVAVGVTVCWTDKDNCRAGLRFEAPSQVVQSTIQRSLRARIDRDLCLDVAGPATAASGVAGL